MALQIFVTTLDDTIGTNGDYALLLSARMYVGPKVGNSWSGTGRYSSIGPSGPSFVVGSGAPTNDIGSDGQLYIDKLTFNAYGPKASGAWGGITKALVGPQGVPGAKGDTGAASTVPGPKGDKGDTGAASTVAGPKGDPGAASTVPGPKGDKGDTGAASTVPGPQGSAGLSVLSGSGAPASSLGVAGQPAYLDTTNWRGYAARDSSGWPTAFTSLIGVKGDKGDQGVQGPVAATIYTGSGAPTASNTAASVTAGSVYIQTDTIPYRLWAPYTAANGWPTTYTAMGGGSFIENDGPPSSSVGAIGDIVLDTRNAFLYPPKTSNGWTSKPINVTGPPGAQGYTALTSQAMSVSQGTYFSGSLSSTATTLGNPNLAAVPLQFVPIQSSALMGYTISNKTGTPTFSLVNTTTATTVMSFTPAANTDSIASFTLDKYPLVAGNNYQWQVTGASGTTYTFQFTPAYLQPAASSAAVISNVGGFSSAAGTAFSSTAVYPGPYGVNGTAGTCRSYQPPKNAGIYAVTGTYAPSTVGAATATVTVTMIAYNYSGQTSTTLGSFTLTNTGKAQVVQFNPVIALTTGQTLYTSITGSGTGAVALDFSLVM